MAIRVERRHVLALDVVQLVAGLGHEEASRLREVGVEELVDLSPGVAIAQRGRDEPDDRDGAEHRRQEP